MSETITPVKCKTCGTVYDKETGKDKAHKRIDWFMNIGDNMKKIKLSKILRGNKYGN